MSGTHNSRPGHGVFPLLNLLESMPGVFQDHLLSALQTRHKAALAATCRQLREQVQHAVNKLNLHAGRCCLVHADEIAPKLPNITDLSLKPGNLHEAMYVLPIFFMQDACRMAGITSLQLLDQLPDRPPDRVQCGSCLAFTSTYDLSAILVTAGKCMPRLAALDFSTHYISDAECAAIALMTGLTRLQLRSTHGTKAGGIARFTSLEELADLRLLDSNLERFSHAGDLAMLLGRSCMTHLQIRYHPILVPAMLSALVDMQESMKAAVEAAAESSGSMIASLGSPTRGGAVTMSASAAAGATPRANPTCPANSGSLERNPPPPLSSLSLVLSPYMHGTADAVRHVARLTHLTHLSLGWYARMGQLVAGEAADEVMPPAVQQQLSQLVGLQELAVGWPVGYAVLTALASLTGLTKLHLGYLPPVKPPPGLQLPSVKRLIMHMKHVELHAAGDVPDWVVREHRKLVAGLVAFPNLTALELSGHILAHTLAHLPTVSPAGLQELLLPQRMVSPTRQDLAALRMLTGLTSLRIGWTAAFHDGPPTLPEAALASSTLQQPSLPEYKVVSLAALTELTGLQMSGGTSGTAAPQQSCAMCGATPEAGCLCRLRRLELVGPVAPAELKHLTGLPSLHTVVLRDNAAWSSGLLCTDLMQLVVGCSSLWHLEVVGSAGVDGLVLEELIRASRPDRLSCVDIVVEGGGKSAVELGMGHQFIGDVLSPAQERGDQEVVWWGGAQPIAEQASEVAGEIGPQPFAALTQEQAQCALRQLNRLVRQMLQINDMLAGSHHLLQGLQQPQAVQSEGLNERVQMTAELMESGLQQHQQQMRLIAQQVQNLQAEVDSAGRMHRNLQMLTLQMQQLAAAGGWLQPQQQLQQLTVQLHQALMPAAPDAELEEFVIDIPEDGYDVGV